MISLTAKLCEYLLQTSVGGHLMITDGCCFMLKGLYFWNKVKYDYRPFYSYYNTSELAAII